jgi:uncharacterized LabA/DUF88 family protein
MPASPRFGNSEKFDIIKSMIGQFVSGRIFVFVDAANILYSQQTLHWRVDYKKLKEYLEKECDLKAIYFYTGRVGENHKQNSFIKKLESLGYIVKAKEVKRIKVSKNSYEWKGNLDVELTIDVLKNVDNFDSLVLMSGDSDFAPLLDAVKAQHKRVIVISTKDHISKELLDRAKYINLRKLKDFIAFYA